MGPLRKRMRMSTDLTALTDLGHAWWLVLGLGIAACGSDDLEVSRDDLQQSGATDGGGETMAEPDMAPMGAKPRDAGADPEDKPEPEVELPNPAMPGEYIAMKDSAVGPDLNMDGRGDFVLFYPRELNGKHPIVAWASAPNTTPEDYPLLEYLASHGFVVIASDNARRVTGEQVYAGLRWLISQNSTGGNPYYERLDVNAVAGAGILDGASAIYEAAADFRFSALAVVSVNSPTSVDRSQQIAAMMKCPTAYFCSTNAPYAANCDEDFRAVANEALRATINASSTRSFLGGQRGAGDERALAALAHGVTAWLRWRLYGEQSQTQAFFGDDCGLCSDTVWSDIQLRPSNLDDWR